ncbi:tetratricopeptide repeat protein [Planctomycetota bacterium]|nr:tetratricopeptide repeat protein [Planctomycetota bacterium]
MSQIQNIMGCRHTTLFVASVITIISLSFFGCVNDNPSANKLITKTDNTINIQVEIARTHLTQGFINTALAEFGLALEDNPDLVEAHIGMGDVYHTIGNYELAKRAYERATSIDPNHYDAHYSLALMHHLLGEVKEAVSVYLRALTINPKGFEANRDLAAAYMQLKKPEIALNYAIRATQLYTENQEAWTNLASIYALLKRYKDAIGCYREAAELGELNDRVLLGLGDAHIHLGNYERAITVLESHISQEPSAIAYERLGLACFKSRQFSTALKHYREALLLDQNDTASMNGIGACLMTKYIQEGRENKLWRDEAAEMWRKSLNIRPNQPHIADLLSRYNRI